MLTFLRPIFYAFFESAFFMLFFGPALLGNRFSRESGDIHQPIGPFDLHESSENLLIECSVREEDDLF